MNVSLPDPLFSSDGVGAVPFQLHPWPDPEASSTTTPRFHGHLVRHGKAFTIHYELQGPIDPVVTAPPSCQPERRDDLWRTTCLEFFLAVPGAAPYWEFNLSPSGDWNVYGFGSYRTAMAPEAAYGSLPFQLRRRPGSLRLDLRCPLPPAIGAEQPIVVGVCAVLESGGAFPTYWALAHPGAEPDFHRREGFLIQL